MKQSEVIHRARLNGVYGVARKLQAVHDGFETRCIGSGNCCRIGLIIPLAECWNIAKSLREDYWKIAEDKGIPEADDRWNDLIASLTASMYLEWDKETGDFANKAYCPFFNNGCGIYEYRPFICRAYGVIAPVQTGVCPRKRLPDGGHELIRDETAKKMVRELDAIVAQWGEDNPSEDFSIFMPAGVLRYLLPEDEFQILISECPDKFMGHPGYQHQLGTLEWESDVEIRSS